MPPDSRQDNRKSSRKRTRLRSGKIATLKNRFLSDCLLHDRSARGVRIRMARLCRLPEHVRFFDDELGELFVARVIWQKSNLAGLLFAGGGGEKAAADRQRAAFTGKYYAISTRGRN